MIEQGWQVKPEVQRDHWGRPMIIPINGGPPEPYTRCTKYVDCLDDTYKLRQWQERMVALGLASRPDLVLRVASLGPEPLDEDANRSWKYRLGDICGAAQEAAKSSAAATIGTALHALAERVDHGQELGPVPPEYVGHIAAYVAATEQLHQVHSEIFTVHDQLRIGGTPDRVVTVDGLPGGYIADLKTGSVSFGVGKMAMQLAVYAHSLIYDPITGKRSPYAVEVSTEWGVIIALSAKTGQCKLHWIDLAAGWEAVQVATTVRSWRARRNLMANDHPALIMAKKVAKLPSPLDPAAAAALAVAITSAESEAELYALWSAAGDRWTAEHTAAAAARKKILITGYREAS